MAHLDLLRRVSTLKLQLIGDFDPLFRAVSDGYIEDMRNHEPSLEDIYLAFYGNGESVHKKVEAIS